MGNDPYPVEVKDAFTGADSFRAESSAPEIAAVSLSGTLVTVAALAEGEAEVTVTASNRAGSTTLRFGVSVIADPAEVGAVGATLEAMGRTVLASASDVIGRRLESDGGRTRVSVTSLYGENGPPGGLDAGMWRAREVFLNERPISRTAGAVGYDRLRDSFELSFRGDGQTAAPAGEPAGKRWTFWGAGDYQSFRGGPADGSEYSGDLRTPYVGLDIAGERWLTGVALSHSFARADYSFAGETEGSGEMSTQLTNVLPYARLRLGEATEVWTIFGAGAGTLETDRQSRGRESRSLTMYLGLVGLRQQVAGSSEGLSLALRGDAGVARLMTADNGGVSGGLATDAGRLRLGAESKYRGKLGSGSFEPFAAVSLRLDQGEAAPGRGLEVAGGGAVRQRRIPVRAGSPGPAAGGA